MIATNIVHFALILERKQISEKKRNWSGKYHVENKWQNSQVKCGVSADFKPG